MFRVHRFSSVGQAGLDVFLADVRVVLLLSPTGGEQFDSQPCTVNHRFANQDLGVHRNAFTPVESHPT